MEKCELTPLTNMRSLLIALAKAMNLINPNMQHHHEQTAYISYQIGYEMGLRGDDLNYAVYVLSSMILEPLSHRRLQRWKAFRSMKKKLQLLVRT